MYPEITVRWTDHWFSDECVLPSDLSKMKPMTHTTHGFLFAENKIMIAVAATVQEDKQGCEVTYIMKKNIVSRSDVAPKQKRTNKKVPKKEAVIADAGSDLRVLGSLSKE